MSLGVPLKIMHEAVHHIVTVELKTGEMFTGYMAEAEVIFYYNRFRIQWMSD